MKQRQKATPSTTTHAMWRKVLKSETLGYEALRKNDWRSQLICSPVLWSTVATIRKDPSEGNVIPVLLTSIQCCNDIGSVFYQRLSSQFASMFTARDHYIDERPKAGPVSVLSYIQYPFLPWAPNLRYTYNGAGTRWIPYSLKPICWKRTHVVEVVHIAY
jgi:hypothetical protein